MSNLIVFLSKRLSVVSWQICWTQHIDIVWSPLAKTQFHLFCSWPETIINVLRKKSSFYMEWSNGMKTKRNHSVIFSLHDYSQSSHMYNNYIYKKRQRKELWVMPAQCTSTLKLHSIMIKLSKTMPYEWSSTELLHGTSIFSFLSYQKKNTNAQQDFFLSFRCLPRLFGNSSSLPSISGICLWRFITEQRHGTSLLLRVYRQRHLSCCQTYRGRHLYRSATPILSALA